MGLHTARAVLSAVLCSTIAHGHFFERVATTAAELEADGTIDRTVCQLNTNRTCITDGDGDHNNSELCYMRVAESTTLTANVFDIEPNADYLVVGGMPFSGNASTGPPANLTAVEGTVIAFYSNSNVTSSGFSICANAGDPARGIFGLLYASAGTCEVQYTQPGRACISDGAGDYIDNAGCIFSVLQDVSIETTSFDIEACCDVLTVGASAFTGSVGPTAVRVSAGSPVLWFSNEEVTRSGYEICSELHNPPSPQPPSPSTLPPPPRPVVQARPPSPPEAEAVDPADEGQSVGTEMIVGITVAVVVVFAVALVAYKRTLHRPPGSESYKCRDAELQLNKLHDDNGEFKFGVANDDNAEPPPVPPRRPMGEHQEMPLPTPPRPSKDSLEGTALRTDGELRRTASDKSKKVAYYSALTEDRVPYGPVDSKVESPPLPSQPTSQPVVTQPVVYATGPPTAASELFEYDLPKDYTHPRRSSLNRQPSQSML